MIHRLMIAAIASVLLVSIGCRHRCCLNDPDKRPNPYRPQAPNSPFLLPPAGVPTTPAPVNPPGGGSIVPGVGPTDPRNYYPPPDFAPPSGNSQGNKPPAEVLLPDPLPNGASSRSATPGDPGYGILGTPAKPNGTAPPVAASPVTTGLPGFVKVSDGLASGRKPALDGFDALRQAGYRSVVYLHAPGTDVSAAREVAEKRQLKFIAIEASPEKLVDAVDRFNATLAERSNRSAYVYDDDGVRAGALWYLHFRTAASMNDDAARVRAKPLGLTDQGDEANAFAIATQRYLETR